MLCSGASYDDDDRGIAKCGRHLVWADSSWSHTMHEVRTWGRKNCAHFVLCRIACAGYFGDKRRRTSSCLPVHEAVAGDVTWCELDICKQHPCEMWDLHTMHWTSFLLLTALSKLPLLLLLLLVLVFQLFNYHETVMQIKLIGIVIFAACTSKGRAVQCVRILQSNK